MLLQQGRFIIKDISQINLVEPSSDGIRRIIDLNYMGQFEYEGNSVPISRMFIEYYKDEYQFYPIDIYNNNNNEQMYFYFNSILLKDKPQNYLYNLAKKILARNYSLWNYINNSGDNITTDFWWELNGDYFIFFGDKKIELIEYFIEFCYKRDGEKGEIKKKLIKAGYKMK